MNLSREQLMQLSRETGFDAAVLEKVAYLLAILEGINRHPFLQSRLALKGGTALNLFLFNIPRLSVDIDLNYIGALDRETMLAERPLVEEAISAVCHRENLSVQNVAGEHAGGSWSLRYKSNIGGSGSLKIDIDMQDRIRNHPALTWKAQNVRKYKGIG